MSLSDGIKLNKFREGASIIEQENGNDTYFIVAKHNYEPELNGSGLTLRVRKNNYEKRRWNRRNVNKYSDCELDTWFNSTYYKLLSDDLKNAIRKVKMPYTLGGSDSTQSTLSRNIFALSATELGVKSDSTYEEGSVLPTNNLLLSTGSYDNVAQWTRSPAAKSNSSKNTKAVAIVFNNQSNVYEARDVECILTEDDVSSCAIYARPAFAVQGNVMVALSYGVEVTSITVPDAQKNLTMFLGNTYQLTPTYAPVDATYPVTSYASSNPFVASIDKNGLLEAKSVGETSITISIDNITLICSVTVKNH